MPINSLVGEQFGRVFGLLMKGGNWRWKAFECLEGLAIARGNQAEHHANPPAAQGRSHTSQTNFFGVGSFPLAAPICTPPPINGHSNFLSDRRQPFCLGPVNLIAKQAENGD